MSSTNSSDRLTLRSYATFNYHIPIHDHSWRQHQWKQTETMVALASLALQSAKKIFQKSNLEKKKHDTYFVWSWCSCTKRWYWSLHILGTTDFFPGHFRRQWNLTKVSSAQMSMETPMFVSASQNTTLKKPLWRWHCISSAATASNQ